MYKKQELFWNYLRSRKMENKWSLVPASSSCSILFRCTTVPARSTGTWVFIGIILSRTTTAPTRSVPTGRAHINLSRSGTAPASVPSPSRSTCLISSWSSTAPASVPSRSTCTFPARWLPDGCCTSILLSWSITFPSRRTAGFPARGASIILGRSPCLVSAWALIPVPRWTRLPLCEIYRDKLLSLVRILLSDEIF